MAAADAAAAGGAGDAGPAGRLLSVTDPAGATTTRTYDTAGRVTSVTESGGATSTFTDDTASNLVASTDPNGGTVTYEYDAQRQLIRRTDPRGGTETFTYDPAGNVATKTDQLGRTWSFAYDQAGRQILRQDPTGRREDITYDAAGRMSALTFGDGAKITYGYDQAGRRTSMSDPSGTTTYTYDSAGALTGTSRITATSPAQVSFTVNPLFGMPIYLGNISVSDSQAGVHLNTPVLFSPVRSTGPGVATGTVNWFTITGLLQFKAYTLTFTVTDNGTAGDTVNIAVTGGVTYNVSGTLGTGNITVRTTPTGAVSVAGSGRLGAPAGSVGYSYDANGRLDALTYPDGTTATLAYDADGHLTSLVNLATLTVVAYTYNADGQLAAETFPGGGRSYTYSGGRLSGYTQTIDGTTTETQLTRDATGRITTDTTDGAATVYGYDPAGQLSSVTGPGGTVTYTYDAAGNRVRTDSAGTVTDYTYDAAGQLTSATRDAQTSAYTWDPSGRLTLEQRPGATIETTWDSRGQLTSERTTVGAASWTDGRTTTGDGDVVALTHKAPGGQTSTVDLTWDMTGRLLATKTDATTTDYLYGLGRTHAVTGGVAEPFAYDVHASATTTPDTAGIVAAASYDPFGHPTGGTFADDPFATPVEHATPAFGYRGELHAGANLHLRNRTYTPHLGRFNSRDPLQGTSPTPTQTNPYVYANNDPLNRIDPLGLSSAGLGGDSPFNMPPPGSPTPQTPTDAADVQPPIGTSGPRPGYYEVYMDARFPAYPIRSAAEGEQCAKVFCNPLNDMKVRVSTESFGGDPWRELDVYSAGNVHEVKTGLSHEWMSEQPWYQGDTKLLRQADKDAWLLTRGSATRLDTGTELPVFTYTWDFYPGEEPTDIGPTSTLTAELLARGLDVALHYYSPTPWPPPLPAPLPEKVRQKLEALLLEAQLILAAGIGLIGVGGIGLAIELSLMYGPALAAALGTVATEGVTVATGAASAATAYLASSTLWQQIITARTALLPGN